MELPTVGRIVHYRPKFSDQHFAGVTLWAAIVTQVHVDRLELTAFPPGFSPLPVVADLRDLDSNLTAPGTWRWPPRA